MAKKGKVQVFEREDGDWGVRIIAANGKKLVATEGYRNKSYALKFAGQIVDGSVADKIEVVSG